MIDGHHNHVYIVDGSDNIPIATGDRYYGQDLGRDFFYLLDRIGMLRSKYAESLPSLISGGVATKGTGDTLDITVAIGLVDFDVEIPDVFTSLPPTKKTASIIAMVESTVQTNMAIASATLDGVTVNYVKLAYAEADGGEVRSRAKKTGSYEYRKEPSFLITVDSTPPTSKELQLDTFTGTGGGAFTFSGSQTSKAHIPLILDNSNDLKKIELKEGQGNDIGTDASGNVYDVPTGEIHSIQINSSEIAKIDSSGIDLVSGATIKENNINVSGFDIDGVVVRRKTVTSAISGTSVSIPHGISNAYTNNRIQGAFATMLSGTRYYLNDIDGSANGMSTIYWDNTNITIVRGAAPATYTIKVHIFYID